MRRGGLIAWVRMFRGTLVMGSRLVHCEFDAGFRDVQFVIVDERIRETSTMPDFVPVMDKLLRGLTIGLALGQYPILRTNGGF